MAGEADAFLLIFIAFLFPPAAVAFVAGCGADLCVNILLTMLGYLPGCIHAFWIVLKRAEANERYGYKNWIYTGMGEYRPYDRGRPSSGQPGQPYGQPRMAPPPPPPPPPASAPGQQPPTGAPPPSQAPVEQNKGGYQQPAAPAGAYPGPPSDPPPTQAPVDQGSGGPGNMPPPPPTEQKHDHQAPSQVPVTDQK